MNVLVSPLDWGLGHASRCVPVIANYIAQGHSVTIASSGYAKQFLLLQFPLLPHLDIPSYNIRYAASKTQIFSMLRNLYRVIKAARSEHAWLQNYLQNHACDLVISDNRFGLFSNTTQCIYITHQVMVKMPKMLTFLEPLVYQLHCKIISKFHACWIPDAAGSTNLSGDLAHKYPLPNNARFVGLLSRFSQLQVEPSSRFDVVIIISGPEPQRSMFERQCIETYKTSVEPVLILSGRPGDKEIASPYSHIHILPHVPDAELAAYCLGAKKIICRSGYSSIMDMSVLNCLSKVVFVPTPGQTEQAYLALLHTTP